MKSLLHFWQFIPPWRGFFVSILYNYTQIVLILKPIADLPLKNP
jgi:hypothetical protein